MMTECGMRGSDQVTGSLFSYVDLEERIPVRHPLRKIRAVVNDALRSLDAEFDRLYAGEGRPSIAPERLIRASLLQILYSTRSERQLMEQMDYNLLFRWFVGLGIDDVVWVPTVFTKNRDRLLTTDMSRKIMAAILAHRTRGGTAAVGRPFLGRRHPGEGLGVDEEFPAEGKSDVGRGRGSRRSARWQRAAHIFL